MLSADMEKAIVDKVYKELYTPLGIRTLPYYDERYKSQYIGRLIDRDKAYHMGTSWGYITGFSYLLMLRHMAIPSLRKKMQLFCLNR